MKHLDPTALAEHWYVIFLKFCCKDLAFTNSGDTEFQNNVNNSTRKKR